MLLTLIAGQVVCAKTNVELSAGYVGENFSEKIRLEEEHYFIDKASLNGFAINLTGNYSFMKEISIKGEIGVRILSGLYSAAEYDGDEIYSFGPYGYKHTIFNFSLFGRYDLSDIFALNTFNIGAQLGLIGSTSSIKNQAYVEGENKEFMLFVVLGVYANLNIVSKINIYSDLKFPVGTLYATSDGLTGFFKYFLYDVTFGITYEIFPNINLGVEGNVSNVNDNGVNIAYYKKFAKETGKGDEEYKYSSFNVGAKVSYSF